MRAEYELYPDYTAELNAIKENGINEELLRKIIEKHQHNADYNRQLYKRYMVLDGEVPIFNRKPRFTMPDVDGQKVEPINNKINNDFFGEIIDFKVGYFAGTPISYSYSRTDESEEDTGGEEAVKEARKTLTDFVSRNNMYDVDMEITKHASIGGYAGRLMYHDLDGNERAMALPSYEAIVLSSTNVMEPEYGIRYYEAEDINGAEYWVVEYYDEKEIRFYEGQLGSLQLKDTIANLYGFCPLQLIPNNNEMLGDAEKVLADIDAYDRIVSDSSNQIEGQIHSKEVYENVNITPEEIARGNYTGAIQFYNGSGQSRIYKLESNINDTFVEHQLQRLEENIYRASKTPNLSDNSFAGNATGVALKFKLTGLEAKCGMFQAKMVTAGVYMFKLLAAAWEKKGIHIDPLQCIMEFKRNFPLDTLGNAQAAQALIAAGIPEEVAWSIAIPEIDDIDYVMQLAEEKKQNIPSLEDMVMEDMVDENGLPIEENGEEEEEIEENPTF